MLHLNKIKRNKTISNKKDEQRYLDLRNKTIKRLKNNYVQTRNSTNIEQNSYVGNCFMKLDSRYFDLYPIENHARYHI